MCDRWRAPLGAVFALWLVPAVARGGDAGVDAAAEPAPAVACGAWRLVEATVRGSLTGTVISAMAGAPAKLGDQVAAHLGRIFMWDLDLRRDVEPGDRLRLHYRLTEAGEVEIGAARYQSRRLARTLLAYRFTPAGDAFASYWDETGLERARRLKASPMPRYEQITALLKDRPTHQGMDFKAPVGSEIVAPRAGVATRSNWKLRGNGTCLELRYDDGTMAKFLHLSAIKVRPPGRVRPGQLIALSGNTGRSTAPHLHYQLNRGPRTVDPVDYHGVIRRQLVPADLTRFRSGLAAFDSPCPPAR